MGSKDILIVRSMDMLLILNQLVTLDLESFKRDLITTMTLVILVNSVAM